MILCGYIHSMSAWVTQFRKTKTMLLRPEMVCEGFSVPWYNITPQISAMGLWSTNNPLFMVECKEADLKMVFRQARMKVKVKCSKHEWVEANIANIRIKLEHQWFWSAYVIACVADGLYREICDTSGCKLLLLLHVYPGKIHVLVRACEQCKSKISRPIWPRIWRN